VASLVNNSRERKRFMRFAMVGFFGAIVDFGTFNLLTGLFGFSAVVASVFSFIAAIISNFTWNRFWTYPDSRSKRIYEQLVQFTAVSVVGLAIRTPIIAVLEGPLRRFFAGFSFIQFRYISPDVLGNNLALAFAVITVMFWNFFINRYWTYGDIQ
jgi:putative flippase GtrA